MPCCWQLLISRDNLNRGNLGDGDICWLCNFSSAELFHTHCCALGSCVSETVDNTCTKGQRQDMYTKSVETTNQHNISAKPSSVWYVHEYRRLRLRGLVSRNTNGFIKGSFNAWSSDLPLFYITIRLHLRRLVLTLGQRFGRKRCLQLVVNVSRNNNNNCPQLLPRANTHLWYDNLVEFARLSA